MLSSSRNKVSLLDPHGVLLSLSPLPAPYWIQFECKVDTFTLTMQESKTVPSGDSWGIMEGLGGWMSFHIQHRGCSFRDGYLSLSEFSGLFFQTGVLRRYVCVGVSISLSEEGLL